MKLASKNPRKLKTWEKLETHFKETKNINIKEYFEKNINRSNEMSCSWENFFVDFSKNRINKKGLILLKELAQEAKLPDAIESYFEGKKINSTEKRAVLHTALRNFSDKSIFIDDKDIMPDIRVNRNKMEMLSEQIIEGKWKGFSGKSISHVVNVGIGGSELGPSMVNKALSFYKNHIKTHFISNIEGDHVREVLKNCPVETTLFIIVSKTFTTQETISNANRIKKWFLESSTESSIPKHFIAVSTNINKALEFGITRNNIFPMNEWVGGRFSLWSAVGLITSISVGYKNFESLLQGAEKMDIHFRNTSFENNIPVLLGLISIWYNNFYNAESEAVIPYSEYLKTFPAYLQQTSMESNGKSIDRNGNPVDYQTGNLIWGATGTNAQHAFFQLIHQGTKLIPVDFIGFKTSLYGEEDHQDKLMSNFFGQTDALMEGKNEEHLKLDKVPDKLIPFKTFKGNKPSNTILIEELNPFNLGALIAMYEHKIFVQGIIWNIYSFDQWGVELGKVLAKDVLNEIKSSSKISKNKSTKQLVNFYKKI
tara:strand:+ start:3337 stop:4953 length:1617 start_codon:yes stop_codon:yes gene_type:complete